MFKAIINPLFCMFKLSSEKDMADQLDTVTSELEESRPDVSIRAKTTAYNY